MNFTLLKTAVQRQFNKMKDKTLLKVNAPGDALWTAYLDAFPDGTRVRVKGDPPASWMKNSLFMNTAFGNGGALGIVNSSFLDEGGKLKVATRLPAGNDGWRVVVFSADDLELAP